MFKIDYKSGKIIIEDNKLNETLYKLEFSKIRNFFDYVINGEYVLKTAFNFNKQNQLLYDVEILIGIKETKEKMILKFHLIGKKKKFEIIQANLNKISIADMQSTKQLRKFIKVLKPRVAEEIEKFLTNIKNDPNYQPEEYLKKID